MSTTTEPMSRTDHEFHRKIAAECFNRTWDYLEKKNRGPDDDQMMLSLAHASRYQWSLIGKPSNFTTGDWQISRVYVALNRPDLALSFAKTALEISQKPTSRSFSYQPTKAWHAPMPRQRNTPMPKSSSTKRACNYSPSVLILKTGRFTRIRSTKLIR